MGLLMGLPMGFLSGLRERVVIGSSTVRSDRSDQDTGALHQRHHVKQNDQRGECERYGKRP
jgi:hypothetical protein